MTIQTLSQSASYAPTTTARAPSASLPARSERRQREFGTGYGRSSGYAAARGYAGTASLAMFRFA